MLQRTGAAASAVGADGLVAVAQQTRLSRGSGRCQTPAVPPRQPHLREPAGMHGKAGNGCSSWPASTSCRKHAAPSGVVHRRAVAQRLAADEQASPGLEQLAQRARQRGIRLELLLGEPTWVLPQGRGNMLALLQKVQSMPFGMVHLDLERSQLPEYSKGLGPQCARQPAGGGDSCRLPISLTTHHRELREPGFLRACRRPASRKSCP